MREREKYFEYRFQFLNALCDAKYGRGGPIFNGISATTYFCKAVLGWKDKEITDRVIKKGNNWEAYMIYKRAQAKVEKHREQLVRLCGEGMYDEYKTSGRKNRGQLMELCMENAGRMVDALIALRHTNKSNSEQEAA